MSLSLMLWTKFVETAQEVCKNFEEEGFWADFIDPTSGRLVTLNKIFIFIIGNCFNLIQKFNSPYTHAVFYETDERYQKLGFEIVDYGCCKVISHHEWGTKAYVGCILTNASLNGKCVKETIKKVSFWSEYKWLELKKEFFFKIKKKTRINKLCFKIKVLIICRVHPEKEVKQYNIVLHFWFKLTTIIIIIN